MQRLGGSCGQRQKSHLKYLYTLSALCLLAFAGCKKDKHQDKMVTVTIQQKSIFNENTYAATVENPDPAIHSFLCTLAAGQPKPTYNCTDAIYITNLPVSLKIPGTKITFNGWKDSGQPLLFSSINHAHELEVYNAQKTN
jgi:hypothetical protein